MRKNGDKNQVITKPRPRGANKSGTTPEKKSGLQALTDTLRLPDEIQSSARDYLLPLVQQQTQALIELLWPYLDLIGATVHQAWKALQELAKAGTVPSVSPPTELYIPDRVWRCILESAGRTLRQQADRKGIFELLLPALTPEAMTNEQALQKAVFDLAEHIKGTGSYEKVGYLLNVAEQTLRFYLKHERLPLDYYELQPCPVLKNPFLTLAADDGRAKGQVYQMEVQEQRLRFRLKYPLIAEPRCKKDWTWTSDGWLKVPPLLAERFKQNAKTLAPNLRIMEGRHGQPLAVLDFITANAVQPLVGAGNFLAFDWGVRRLATIVILDKEGQQLTPPIFLNTDGFNRNQAHLRTQIDYLKAKRDRLPSDHYDRSFYQAEIDHCWRKYEARNDLLAHFTSNLVLCLAMIYDCDVIAGEWLKTLKARQHKSGPGKAGRWRNWRINTTIREAIAAKIRYKAGLVGKRFVTVWPRGTSHECPRCGERGITCKSPDDRASIRWGAWFICKSCGYNADRDYIAAVNIGRRAVWKQQEVIRPASYIGVCGAALLFPSQAADRFVRKLITTLKGLSQVTHLRPQYVLLC